MTALILLTIHWYVSLFFQTFFLHRYCSHKMFTLSPFWERFFYFMTFLSQGVSFLHPRGYAIMHIKHHQNSDTENDPHSPQNYKNIVSMMLSTYEKYKNSIIEANHTQNPNYTEIPIWPKLDQFAEGKFNLILWPVVYISIYTYLNIDLVFYPLIILHCLVGPIQGAIVNWCGHKIGYQNYDNGDYSKNTLPIDFLLMGELYQNNHHKNGNKLNFAAKWFELDFTYQITKVLNNLNIIKIN